MVKTFGTPKHVGAKSTMYVSGALVVDGSIVVWNASTCCVPRNTFVSYVVQLPS